MDGEIRYRRGTEYVEHFTDLLTRAVADRLRSRSAGVLMSGGLDSTTIAATAKRCLAADPRPFDLRAYTTVCVRLVTDPSAATRSLTADALAIPIHYRVVDDYQMFERWDKIELRRPKPEADPLLAVHVDQLSDAAANGRVLLTGHGADPALRVPARYAVDLVKHGEFGRLSAEVGRYIMQCRRLPRVRIGTHVRRWLGFARSAADRTPSWLNATARSRPAARWKRRRGSTRPVHTPMSC